MPAFSMPGVSVGVLDYRGRAGVALMSRGLIGSQHRTADDVVTTSQPAGGLARRLLQGQHDLSLYAIKAARSSRPLPLVVACKVGRREIKKT